MKILLIDDELLARMIVKEYLQSYPALQVVQECNDGFEGVKAIMQHQPELIFLDVQMPKITGFEMLELVEQPPAVIFTTAFDDYAMKAFEAHAVDYLLKPFSRERFDKAVQKFLGGNEVKEQRTALPALLQTVLEQPAAKERIVVKTGGKIKIIPVADIDYVEAADDYVKLHTGEGAFLKNKTMAYLEGTLQGQQFVRTHRSYLVNVHQITRIDPYEKDAHLAILKSGAQIPVSKSGYVKLKAVLGI